MKCSGLCIHIGTSQSSRTKSHKTLDCIQTGLNPDWASVATPAWDLLLSLSVPHSLPLIPLMICSSQWGASGLCTHIGTSQSSRTKSHKHLIAFRQVKPGLGVCCNTSLRPLCPLSVPRSLPLIPLMISSHRHLTSSHLTSFHLIDAYFVCRKQEIEAHITHNEMALQTISCSHSPEFCSNSSLFCSHCPQIVLHQVLFFCSPLWLNTSRRKPSVLTGTSKRFNESSKGTGWCGAWSALLYELTEWEEPNERTLGAFGASSGKLEPFWGWKRLDLANKAELRAPDVRKRLALSWRLKHLDLANKAELRAPDARKRLALYSRLKSNLFTLACARTRKV